MLSKFFNKPVWNAEDWEIYFENLETLRVRDGIKKKKLNEKIGVGNAFRKDTRRPSKGTLLAICQEFNVTMAWFSVRHGKNSPKSDEDAPESTILHEPRAYYHPEEEQSTSVRSLCVLFQDKDRAQAAINDLIYIEKLDADKYDEILEKIFGAYVNLNHKKAGGKSAIGDI